MIYLERAARKPQGDVILCDVAAEDASVIVSDLRELDVDNEGSIAIEHIDSAVSTVAAKAERAAAGHPGDAVVWEEVEARTSENTELDASFLAFMALACLIAAVGIFLDSPILIVGAMIVGPEYGPLAGLSVAIVQRRRDVARRSLRALAVGFPVGITAAFLFTLALRATDLDPAGFVATAHPLTDFISQPDRFSFIVAFVAGIAGRPRADLLEVRGADRSAGLGDHDPRRGQHRSRLRVRRVARVARRDAAAGDQPDGDRARRGPHPVRAAAPLRAPAPRPPPGLLPGEGRSADGTQPARPPRAEQAPVAE